MDLEIQVEGKDQRGEPAVPSVVDINQATVEGLQVLPGIGATLARRIVDYREERGGFRSPEDLMAVSGISQATYERLADRLTATPPEEVPSREAAEEETAIPPEATALQEVPPPGAEEEAPEEERPSPPQAPPPAEEAARVPAGKAAPGPEPSRPGGLYWLWPSLLGGLLGMIFALLVFSGINGSLDLNNSHAVLAVQSRMDTLAGEADSLQGQIDGLRQRLDKLEGLTVRMDEAESAVDTLRQETERLEQRADGLEEKLAGLTEDLAAVQTQTRQATTFFSRLQALLQDVFGEVREEGTGPTPESPLPTPTPTQ